MTDLERKLQALARELKACREGLDRLLAAEQIGKELGQPRNERAEERLAADLAATDPERFDEATGPCDPDRCPKCGAPMDYQEATPADPSVGIFRSHPGGKFCTECDYDEGSLPSAEAEFKP